MVLSHAVSGGVALLVTSLVSGPGVATRHVASPPLFLQYFCLRAQRRGRMESCPFCVPRHTVGRAALPVAHRIRWRSFVFSSRTVSNREVAVAVAL